MSQLMQQRYDCLSCGARYVTVDHLCRSDEASNGVGNLLPVEKRLGAATTDQTQPVPQVGDVASEEKGSGARWLGADKVPYEFVPIHLTAGAARVFKHVTERPERPYPMWNWAKGMPWLVPFGCLMRHMSMWFIGEENDPETGLPHLDHAHCNLLMLIHYRDAYLEGDNRPKKWFKHD